MKYTEHNRNTLREALNRLPQHEPPDETWEQLEAELGKSRGAAALKAALGQLPSYSPPPSVWEAIESGLEQPAKAPSFRFRRLILPAAAASIAALAAWFVFHPFGEAELKTTYAYETARINSGLFENDWDEDEEALQAVAGQFREDPLARRQDQYQALLEEWRELEEAKAEVKEIMELYGKDARLVRQMSAIERERSKVAKAMAMGI